MKKFILAGFMAIILLTGVGGCMEKEKVPVKEKVLTYLKDKYKEDFTITGSGGESMFDGYNEVYAKPVNSPKINVTVYYYPKDGDMIDNYMSYLMADQVSKVMSDLSARVYPKSKAFYLPQFAAIPDTQPGMSVDEYIKAINNGIYLGYTLYIVDPDYQTNKEKKVEELRLLLKDNHYQADVGIHYIKADKFDLINKNNLEEMPQDWQYLFGEVILDRNYEFMNKKVEWRN